MVVEEGNLNMHQHDKSSLVFAEDSSAAAQSLRGIKAGRVLARESAEMRSRSLIGTQTVDSIIEPHSIRRRLG